MNERKGKQLRGGKGRGKKEREYKKRVFHDNVLSIL